MGVGRKPTPCLLEVDMKRVEDPNVKLDARHELQTSVKPPSEEGVDLVRCENCMRLVTGPEIRRYGKCPRCDAHRFRGASIPYFRKGGWYSKDWWSVSIRNILRHWTIWGEEGWGWKRNSTNS
jgi:hypothetical protein